MKKKVVCIILVGGLMFGSIACSESKTAQMRSTDSSQNSENDVKEQDASENHNIEEQNKILERENLTELFFENNKIVPGESLEWYMSKEDFLDSFFGSEILDPASELFEEYRVGEMQNGMLSYTPAVLVNLNAYDIQMDTTFLFDEEGELIKALYRLVYPASDINTYMILLNGLVAEADVIEKLEAEQVESRDLTEQNILENPVSLKWMCSADACYFQINSVEFQDYMLLDLILSVDVY